MDWLFAVKWPLRSNHSKARLITSPDSGARHYELWREPTFFCADLEANNCHYGNHAAGSNQSTSDSTMINFASIAFKASRALHTWQIIFE